MCLAHRADLDHGQRQGRAGAPAGRRGAMLQAQALSRSYTEQLQRTVSGLNQITLTLKYYW